MFIYIYRFAGKSASGYELCSSEQLIGRPVHDPADFGQHQPEPRPLKQLFAQLIHLGKQLLADRRLGQPQLSAGLRNASLAHDGPKMQHVVIIVPFHAPRYSSNYSMDRTHII